MRAFYGSKKKGVAGTEAQWGSRTCDDINSSAAVYTRYVREQARRGGKTVATRARNAGELSWGDQVFGGGGGNCLCRLWVVSVKGILLMGVDVCKIHVCACTV